MVHDKIDEWTSKDFRDDTVYLVEKQVPYTSWNASREDLHLINTPSGEAPNYVGDVDIFEYRIPDQKIILREYKGESTIKPEMTKEERCEKSELIDKGHDQINDILNALEQVEASNPDIEYEVDHEVVAWVDRFPQGRFNIDEINNYEGHHYVTDEAAQMAKDSEAFQALDEGLFGGEMLWGGERLRKEVDE